MFEYLCGRVEYKKIDYIAMDINGIGYKIFVSLRTQEKIGEKESIRLYIYNYIKEDTYKLIGFLTENERNIFELLLSVKGIGMSLALSIMSTFNTEDLISCVNSNDYKTLKKVPKLGEKKAKQLILDIGGKLVEDDEMVENTALIMETYSALEALGYSKKEIDKLITKTEIQDFKTTQDAIKSILKKL